MCIIIQKVDSVSAIQFVFYSYLFETRDAFIKSIMNTYQIPDKKMNWWYESWLFYCEASIYSYTETSVLVLCVSNNGSYKSQVM